MLFMRREGFVIALPCDRSELWCVGEIKDGSFPNSLSRRKRVTCSGLSPTISSQNMSHILYLDAYETD